MEPNDKTARIELLKRLNRRRLDLNKFDELVHPILGHEPGSLALFDPEKSYALEERVEALLEQSRTTGHLISSGQVSESGFQSEIDRALVGCDDMEFVIFMCHWQHIGGLLVRGSVLKEVALQLLKCDGDTLYGSTSNLEKVILMDFLRDGLLFEISSVDLPD